MTASKVWSFNTQNVFSSDRRETNYKLQALQIYKLINRQSIIHQHHNSLHKLTKKSILSSFLNPHQFTLHRKMTLKTQSTASDVNPFGRPMCRNDREHVVLSILFIQASSSTKLLHSSNFLICWRSRGSERQIWRVNFSLCCLNSLKSRLCSACRPLNLSVRKL